MFFHFTTSSSLITKIEHWDEFAAQQVHKNTKQAILGYIFGVCAKVESTVYELTGEGWD